MHLTSADKRAARDGFKFVVLRGGERVCYTTTAAEAKRECGKHGRVVSLSRGHYAARNPKRRNPSNGAINRAFLSKLDVATRNRILSNIAKHYGITTQEAYAEVTDAEAEHLLDYVTGPERAATSVLMQRHGLRHNPSSGAKYLQAQKQAAKLDAAIMAHATGKKLLHVGSRIGNDVVTKVGTHTIQLMSKDGWSASVQIPFIGASGEMTSAWHRATAERNPRRRKYR